MTKVYMWGQVYDKPQTDDELAELCRVENKRLREALIRVERWFNTDPEIVEAMDERTRADHERQLRLIREALGKKP